MTLPTAVTSALWNRLSARRCQRAAFIGRLRPLGLLIVAVVVAAIAPATHAQERPNIIFIQADDLGYSDLGAFGSEIPTPSIDALARDGMMLTAFYTSLACSPTRAMFMSGMSNHLAGVGVQGAPRRDEHRNQSGYVGYLNFQVASLAELLADAGYDTYMTGKWHLGNEVETGPRARGFSRSFVSLDGAAHLGPWDWRGPQPARYRDGDTLVEVDDDFYSTRFYTERMIEYIEQGRGAGRPFFAWLAYTAPHWPLQAPAESIARFEGRYDDGYAALYAERFARQKRLGLVAENVEPIPDERFQPAWEALTQEEKEVAARHMEIYAAMVSDLDTYIGRVIAYLDEIGELENTFIVFASDNGPESSRMDLGRNIQEHVGQAYDHSVANLGSATSYVNYGRNWASVSASPFNRHKATAFEGGIRAPAIVYQPGKVPAGSRSAQITTIMDLLPTFLELAGTEHPGSRYRDRDVLPPQGVSLLPLVYGETDAVRPADHPFGWELHGHRAVRVGDAKLVWDQAMPPEQRHWQLFDLAADPSEQHDLSAAQPGKLAEMMGVWSRWEKENGVIY